MTCPKCHQAMTCPHCDQLQQQLACAEGDIKTFIEGESVRNVVLQKRIERAEADLAVVREIRGSPHKIGGQEHG